MKKIEKTFTEVKTYFTEQGVIKLGILDMTISHSPQDEMNMKSMFRYPYDFMVLTVIKYPEKTMWEGSYLLILYLDKDVETGEDSISYELRKVVSTDVNDDIPLELAIKEYNDIYAALHDAMNYIYAYKDK